MSGVLWNTCQFAGAPSVARTRSWDSGRDVNKPALKRPTGRFSGQKWWWKEHQDTWRPYLLQAALRVVFIFLFFRWPEKMGWFSKSPQDYHRVILSIPLKLGDENFFLDQLGLPEGKCPGPAWLGNIEDIEEVEVLKIFFFGDWNSLQGNRSF